MTNRFLLQDFEQIDRHALMTQAVVILFPCIPRIPRFEFSLASSGICNPQRSTCNSAVFCTIDPELIWARLCHII
jgi:hypothetical protein